MIEVDEMTLAYLQIHNDTMACDFSDFHAAVTKVLGRDVYTHEFVTKNTEIKAEIDEKFNKFCKRQRTERRESNE